MNTLEVEALFGQTLLGDCEGPEACAAVDVLRQDGSLDIFEHAAAWCRSDDPLKRTRAAAILCQFRRAPVPKASGDKPKWKEPEWLFRDESYSLVTKMLENEQHPMVLNSAICALGHLYNAGAIPLILRYQDHPDENVQFAVTFALGCFSNDPQSVCGLLKLTSDADDDVRDWAVFGLGVQGDADSPEIRDTLLRCLDDANEDVREEAAVGLGKRRDQRLLPTLRTMLDRPNSMFERLRLRRPHLGLDQDPPDWTAADYKAALMSKFQILD